MADSADKLLAKLAALDDTLDDLEEKLEPLLSQTLPETLLPLDTIQQVKLNVALPYLVYDLIFIYLKTRGIDPKTHPVVGELDRVRQYFDKIKNAEDPEKRKTAVDKAAANRFIKHAIAQLKDQRTPGEIPSSSAPVNTHIRFGESSNASPSPAPSTSARPSPSVASIPVKVTSKMLARAEWQKNVAAGAAGDEWGEDDEDVDALEVFDGEEEDEEEDENAEPEAVSSQVKNKGKGKAVDRSSGDSDSQATGGKKRRRHAMDPFAGYGEESQGKAAKSKKKKSTTTNEDVAMDDSAGGHATPKSTKKEKGSEKKAKRKAKKASSG